MTLFSKKHSERGFTLIELLVVIAIIGVLASVVLASLNNARRKSRDARRVTDIKQIQLALELYFDGAGAGQYPLASATCDGTASQGLEVLATNNYIPQIPRDPSNSATCYAYASGAVSGNRLTYHLGTTLEDSTNPALNGDKDCDSTDNAPVCTAGATFTNGFDGAVATTYDVTP